MLENIYNQRITILNKYKQSDNGTKTDEWFKTVLDNAAWYFQSERNMSGTSVVIGTFIKVLIPFNDSFREYLDWKKLEDKSTTFSMSAGDYIVLGDVEEEVDASNIVKTMQNYKPNVCKVSHVEVAHNRFNAVVQLYIEGL